MAKKSDTKAATVSESMKTETHNGSAAKGTPQAETQYSASDFMAASDKLFADMEKPKRPSRFLIAAAFKYAGKETATREEGVKLITDFMGKKVE